MGFVSRSAIGRLLVWPCQSRNGRDSLQRHGAHLLRVTPEEEFGLEFRKIEKKNKQTKIGSN